MPRDRRRTDPRTEMVSAAGPRGLLVDYGGVLTTPVTHSFREFCRGLDLPSELVKETFVEAYGDGSGVSPVHQVETGEISGEEFSILLADLLSAKTGVEINPENLIAQLFGRVQLSEPMLMAVQRIREAGVVTGLLSNSWGSDGYPRERFPELFDAVVISGEEGIRKPDAEIFLLAARRLGLAPEACVFVDDLDINAKAAEQVGMIGVVHRSPEETIPHLAELLSLDVARLLAPGA